MPSLKVASLRSRRRLRGAGSSGGGSLFRDLRGMAGAPPTLRVGTPRAPATVVPTCHVRRLLRRRKSPLPAAATPGVLRSLGVVRRDALFSPTDELSCLCRMHILCRTSWDARRECCRTGSKGNCSRYASPHGGSSSLRPRPKLIPQVRCRTRPRLVARRHGNNPSNDRQATKNLRVRSWDGQDRGHRNRIPVVPEHAVRSPNASLHVRETTPAARPSAHKAIVRVTL